MERKAGWDGKAGWVRYWRYGQAEKSPDLAISDPSRFGPVPLRKAGRSGKRDGAESGMERKAGWDGKAGWVRYWRYGQAEKSPDLAISDPSRFGPASISDPSRFGPASRFGPVPLPLRPASRFLFVPLPLTSRFLLMETALSLHKQQPSVQKRQRIRKIRFAESRKLLDRDSCHMLGCSAPTRAAPGRRGSAAYPGLQF